MVYTMDEKIEKVTQAYTKAIDKLTSSVETVGKQVSETQVEMANINGEIRLMNTKIDTLTEDKEKAKSDSKNYVLDRLKLHEAEKHKSEEEQTIKIKLPWKIATGGLGLGGGGAFIYWLFNMFGNK